MIKHDAQETLSLARSAQDSLTIAGARIAGERVLWALQVSRAKQAIAEETTVDHSTPVTNSDGSVLQTLLDTDIPGLDTVSKGIYVGAMLQIAQRALIAEQEVRETTISPQTAGQLPLEIDTIVSA